MPQRSVTLVNEQVNRVDFPIRGIKLWSPFARLICPQIVLYGHMLRDNLDMSEVNFLFNENCIDIKQVYNSVSINNTVLVLIHELMLLKFF